MGPNILVTGPPGSGKSTLVRRVHERLAAAGYEVGGCYAPERRRDGDRVGFDIVNASTDESRLMAHVDRESGPNVGAYRVDVDAVSDISKPALARAIVAADVIVVDEIAPMEVHSDAFVDGVRSALDADRPVLAAIQAGSTTGFIGAVKERSDVELVELTRENRDRLADEITEGLLEVTP